MEGFLTQHCARSQSQRVGIPKEMTCRLCKSEVNGFKNSANRDPAYRRARVSGAHPLTGRRKPDEEVIDARPGVTKTRISHASPRAALTPLAEARSAVGLGAAPMPTKI